MNGVPQREGVDFVREGNTLVFPRRLAQEGRLGLLRWLSLFLGIAGTYRRHDTVDVVYEVGKLASDDVDLGGRRMVATGLPFSPVDESTDHGREH